MCVSVCVCVCERERDRATQLIVFTCFGGVRVTSREHFTDNVSCVRVML